MGFKLNVNNILRQDIDHELVVGKEYSFKKAGLNIIADDIQIWLTEKDWTVFADITILSQTRENDTTTGIYRVEYIYSGDEQKTLTDIFRRMYGWE